MNSGWIIYKITDFIDINPKVPMRQGSSYSFVEMKDLGANNKYVLPSDFKELKGGARFQNQDTLFARITPCLENGKICQVKGLQYEGGFGSTEFLVFRGRDGISDTDFIFYLSRNPAFRRFAESKMIGTSGRQRVAKDAFENLVMELPPLPEQRAIASILSTLDDKIELNLETNKTLEEMAMTLYKHWFVDFGPFKSPVAKAMGDKNGEFVASELGEIPKGWEVKTLGEEFKITIGRTPPRNEQEWFSSIEGIKWVSIKDMGVAGTYIFSTSEYLTKEAVESKNVPKIPTNTVILSFKLTVGRVSITTEEMVSNEAIAHFIKKESTVVSSEYLYLALKSFDYNSLASTSSIATAVNSQTVKAMRILVPGKSVIKAFEKNVTDLFKMIKNNSEEIQTLTTLRDTLLPKLISGEVRVKEAAKTLAEVL